MTAATKYNIKAEAVHVATVAVVAPLSACLSPQLVGLPRFGSNSVLDFAAEITKKSLLIIVAGFRPFALSSKPRFS